MAEILRIQHAHIQTYTRTNRHALAMSRSERQLKKPDIDSAAPRPWRWLKTHTIRACTRAKANITTPYSGTQLSKTHLHEVVLRHVQASKIQVSKYHIVDLGQIKRVNEHHAALGAVKDLPEIPQNLL